MKGEIRKRKNRKGRGDDHKKKKEGKQKKWGGGMKKNFPKKGKFSKNLRSAPDG